MRAKGERALLELVGDASASPRPGRKRKVIAQRIRDIPASALPTFWTEVLDDLGKAYGGTCAYLGMRIHSATGLATVDHFKPKSKHPHLAYDWSNFRLSSHQMNINKGEHEDVLDPFQIEDGCFVLDVGTFKVVPNPQLDAPRRKSVQASIKRLDLNEPTYCKAREEYHDLLLGLSQIVGGPLLRAWLEAECPFVAKELRRR